MRSPCHRRGTGLRPEEHRGASYHEGSRIPGSRCCPWSLSIESWPSIFSSSPSVPPARSTPPRPLFQLRPGRGTHARSPALAATRKFGNGLQAGTRTTRRPAFTPTAKSPDVAPFHYPGVSSRIDVGARWRRSRIGNRRGRPECSLDAARRADRPREPPALNPKSKRTELRL